MSDWMSAVAYVMIALFLGVLLRELGFRGSRLVMILGTVAAVGVASLVIAEIAVSFSSVLGGSLGRYSSAMLKMIGIGYVSGICSDICRDLGEQGLCGAIGVIGRAEIMAVSLPFITEILEQGIKMVEK